jgi:hypothetical protein
MKFDDFYWHDAVIKNIIIDRTNPGEVDEINFEIKWPNENDIKTLVFEGVYWANFKLNFGIIAKENILDAFELNEDDEDLKNFYLDWKGAMNEVKLRSYKIVLNSTGGEIKIIAKKFRVK